MPLKDHKAEIQAVTDIASLIKHQAEVKRRSSLMVGNALRGLIVKKERQEIDLQLLEVSGVTWGAW